MLPRADLNVTSVARSEGVTRSAAIADPRQEAFTRSMAALLGKSIQGDIVSKLTDGSYLVQLNGATARMLLPAGTQVGTQVPLTLVSLTPRPTFQIATSGAQVAHAEAAPALPPGVAAPPLVYVEGKAGRAAAAPDPNLLGQAGSAAAQRSSAHAAALLGRAPLTDAALLPALDSNSTPAQLSPTGRALSGVLTLAMAAPHAQHAVHASAPLTAAPGAPPAQLAAALHDTIGKSGLFYESHVAEWSAGQRPLRELAAEPQMQRAPGGAPAADDSSAAQLINLQLQTQEHARVLWQGQPWPGQDMRWEIQRQEQDDDAPRQDGEEAMQPGWRSALQLRFALLGEIGARLFMSGDQVHLELDAGDPHVGALLRERAGELDTAMQAAGIALASFNIRAGQAAPDG